MFRPAMGQESPLKKRSFTAILHGTMGLADRHYMREGSYRSPMSATVILMITLTVVFAIQCIVDVYAPGSRQIVWNGVPMTVREPWLEKWFAMTPDWLLRGHVWQLITFQFLHAGIWHLLGNLLTLWFLGRFVENVLGRRRFIVAYLVCGVAGGLLQGILMVLLPSHFQPMYGASAGVLGILAIFVRLLPTSEIRLYFVLPVRADVVLWVIGGISLFFTIVPSARGGGVAHAAHLGGILAGIAWVALGWHRDYVRLPWEGFFDNLRQWNPFRTRKRKSDLMKAASVKTQRWPTHKSITVEELPEEEFISQEVDPILDKISAHGIQSLTERERKILEAARNKMARR